MRNLKARLLRAIFVAAYRPSILSVITNPYHIIRKGLYSAISELSGMVTGKILDYGCGSRPYEHLFSRATKYTGIDVTSSGHNHETSKVDVFFDGVRIPFPDSSFDSVVAFEVFEHLFDLPNALSEINRVLRPNGRLLISVPFVWDEHEQPFDFARYTSFALEALASQEDFVVLERRTTSSHFLAIQQLMLAYLSQAVLPQGRVLAFMSQVLIIAPLTVCSTILDRVMPKSGTLYLNNVILLEKPGDRRLTSD